MPHPTYAPLDDALERLSPYATELINGNFNHAPMVAEALCALGRPDAVLPWIEAYRPRLVPRATSGEYIDREDWRAMLGKRDSFAAWSTFFTAELSEAPWWRVLTRWAMRLSPGYSAAATHGRIRVGHAVRGLSESETRVRVGELADALASWAATYAEVPTEPTPARRGLTAREAIAAIPTLPQEQRGPGNITAALHRLGDLPEFASAVSGIQLVPPVPANDGTIGNVGEIVSIKHPGDMHAGQVAELSDFFTRVFLENAVDTRTFIVFVHGVTALHAMANMLPHVNIRASNMLLRDAWRAGCGLYAAFGGAGMAEAIEPAEEDLAALVDRAVANGDEHIVKFTEACVSRHKIAPSPVYPAAIRHALGVAARR